MTKVTIHKTKNKKVNYKSPVECDRHVHNFYTEDIIHNIINLKMENSSIAFIEAVHQ